MRVQGQGRAAGLRLELIWPALVLTLVFAIASAMPVAQADFWWHVVVGESIATTGAIPAVDTFTHTQLGAPYPSYQQFWLMDLVLYWLHTAGGPVLVSTVHALTLTTTYALVLWAARRVSGSWRAASLATLVAAVLGFFNWNIRPQTAAFLFGAVILVSITEYRQSRRAAWIAVIPVAMVLWVNAHGTFPIGLAIVGLWLAAEFLSQVAAVRAGNPPPPTGVTHAAIGLALALLATFVNPGGARWLGYVGAMTANDAVQRASEWMPPDPTDVQGASFFACLLLVAVVLIRSRRRAGLVELVTFLLFAALAIRYVRGSVWFGLVIAPILALHLTQLRGLRSAETLHVPATRSERRFTALALALLAALALAVSAPVRAAVTGNEPLASDTPVAATDFLLTEAPPGPLFNSQHFGSYLIWAAQPEYPVFIDSRVELFSAQVWDDYLAISAGRWDWEELLQGYGIQTLMLEPEYAERLLDAATASPNWVELFHDDTAVILTRR